MWLGPTPTEGEGGKGCENKKLSAHSGVAEAADCTCSMLLQENRNTENKEGDR